jgi:putative intracellular protease/amidase
MSPEEREFLTWAGISVSRRSFPLKFNVIHLYFPGIQLMKKPVSTTDQAVSRLSRRSFISAASAGTAISALSLTSSKSREPAPQEKETGTSADGKMILGMVVFDGFQLLDTFGPLEMFGALKEQITILMIGEKAGMVKSTAGPRVAIDHIIADAPKLDIVMIPGGQGTRREVNNTSFVADLKILSEATPHVASICTGSAVLARTGLLDGLKATTNKRSYKWATSQGEKVVWVPKARWVEDGKYFTSSGISAGTDMALALIEKLFGRETAMRVANGAEYEWNRDPSHDPFAKLNGLVD